MTDKAKKIARWIGIGLVAVGSVAIYFGGGNEAMATAVTGGVFVIVGIVTVFIQGNK